jgi:hypothetical protein
LKRAALYLRASTLDQNAQTQLYDLRELARQRNLEIVHEYRDEGRFRALLQDEATLRDDRPKDLHRDETKNPLRPRLLQGSFQPSIAQVVAEGFETFGLPSQLSLKMLAGEYGRHEAVTTREMKIQSKGGFHDLI